MRLNLRQRARFDLCREQGYFDELKAYVKVHSGLTVSSLNIAQVKQKYGIIERENYNKAKTNDSRQPKCTEEKEEAIVGALKFFR